MLISLWSVWHFLTSLEKVTIFFPVIFLQLFRIWGPFKWKRQNMIKFSWIYKLILFLRNYIIMIGRFRVQWYNTVLCFIIPVKRKFASIIYFIDIQWKYVYGLAKLLKLHVKDPLFSNNCFWTAKVFIVSSNTWKYALSFLSISWFILNPRVLFYIKSFGKRCSITITKDPKIFIQYLKFRL